MEPYTSNLGLLTDSLICPHKALASHLKLVPVFRACFVLFDKIIVPPPISRIMPHGNFF